MHFDPKTARGCVDCGRCLRARFRDMGEVCTLVLFISVSFVSTATFVAMMKLFSKYNYMYLLPRFNPACANP